MDDYFGFRGGEVIIAQRFSWHKLLIVCQHAGKTIELKMNVFKFS